MTTRNIGRFFLIGLVNPWVYFALITFGLVLAKAHWLIISMVLILTFVLVNSFCCLLMISCVAFYIYPNLGTSYQQRFDALFRATYILRIMLVSLFLGLTIPTLLTLYFAAKTNFASPFFSLPFSTY